MKHLTIYLVATFSLLTVSILPAYAQLQGDLPPTGSTSQTSCVNLTTNLGWGTTNADVTTLQNYLAVSGYMNTEATGYFGNITMNAVQSYQTAHNLQATGYVGPLTRGALQSESCGSSGTATATVSSGSVVCPVGYSCTPKTTTTITCPLGYNCVPSSSSNTTLTTSNSSTYVPGSWYNSLIGNSMNNGNSITNTGTNVNTSNGGTKVNITTGQNTNQTVNIITNSASTTNVSSVATQLDAIIANAPTSWPTIAPYRETQRVGAAQT
ncbi:MAG: peptidoglycan-binding domain-containing protein, partial [Candidatus Taylorbacteria bacterium]